MRKAEEQLADGPRVDITNTGVPVDGLGRGRDDASDSPFFSGLLPLSSLVSYSTPQWMNDVAIIACLERLLAGFLGKYTCRVYVHLV